jgi:hypothetical protein
MNIFKVPTPTKHSPLAQEKIIQFPLSGNVSNGITEIFAEISNAKSITTEIDFVVDVNSIDNESFCKWKVEVTSILGEEAIGLIETKIIAEMPYAGELNFGLYMPKYSLLVFEYAMNLDLNIDPYLNYSNIPFNTENCTRKSYQSIMDSIYQLESTMVHYQGKLIATELYPKSTAYIPVTYFEFSDGKIVSFAGYNGPLTIIDRIGSIYKSRTCMMTNKSSNQVMVLNMI